MLRSAVALLVLALVVPAGVDGAQRKKTGPVMEIEPGRHDFGGVSQDQKLRHEFIVRNIGTEDLEIRRIATTCGCTAAVLESRVVKPGASTVLEVVLETRRYKGVVEKSISVASNDGVHTVRVEAFVEVPE